MYIHCVMPLARTTTLEAKQNRAGVNARLLHPQIHEAGRGAEWPGCRCSDTPGSVFQGSRLFVHTSRIRSTGQVLAQRLSDLSGGLGTRWLVIGVKGGQDNKNTTTFSCPENPDRRPSGRCACQTYCLTHSRLTTPTGDDAAWCVVTGNSSNCQGISHPPHINKIK